MQESNHVKCTKRSRSQDNYGEFCRSKACSARRLTTLTFSEVKFSLELLKASKSLTEAANTFHLFCCRKRWWYTLVL